jgi:hypothetical protein
VSDSVFAFLRLRAADVLRDVAWWFADCLGPAVMRVSLRLRGDEMELDLELCQCDPAAVVIWLGGRAWCDRCALEVPANRTDPPIQGHPHGVTTFCFCGACQTAVGNLTPIALKPITWDQVAEWSLRGEL